MPVLRDVYQSRGRHERPQAVSKPKIHRLLVIGKAKRRMVDPHQISPLEAAWLNWLLFLAPLLGSVADSQFD